MPIPGNKLAWAVIQNVTKADALKGDSFKFSEWTPEATMEMANFVRHQPSPFNGTLGDIIDKTPRDLISKIMLEEKFFETWHDGRVVLLGDGRTERMISGQKLFFWQVKVFLITALYLPPLLLIFYLMSNSLPQGTRSLDVFATLPCLKAKKKDMNSPGF